MKKFIKLSVTSGLVALVLSATVLSFAMAALPSDTKTPPDVSTQALLINKIDAILNWVFTAAIILSVVFILLAGFQFVTSGSDPAKLSEARLKIIWAVIGIIVAAAAKGLPYVIVTLLGT